MLLTLATPFVALWCLYRTIGADAVIAVMLAGPVAMVVVGVVAARATRRFKTRIPWRIRRIRHLIPYAVSSDQVAWTRDQVSVMVKQLVMQQLGVSEKKYREDADFIKDFGMN